MNLTGQNILSIYPQKEICWSKSFSQINNTGEYIFSCLAESGSPNNEIIFKIKNNKVFTKNNEVIYGLNNNTIVQFSGNITATKLDLYTNDSPLYLGASRQTSGNISGFNFNCSGANISLSTFAVFGEQPLYYFDSDVLYQSGSVIPITVRNSGAYNINIVSGSVFGGNFSVSGANNLTITGGKTNNFYLINNGEFSPGQQVLNVKLYSNIGLESIFININSPIVANNLFYIDLTPPNNLIFYNAFNQYLVSFANNSGSNMEISLIYTSGITGNYYRNVRTTGLSSIVSGQISGFISGSGLITGFVTGKLSGYNSLLNAYEYGTGSGVYSEPRISIDKAVSENYSTLGSGYGVLNPNIPIEANYLLEGYITGIADNNGIFNYDQIVTGSGIIILPNTLFKTGFYSGYSNFFNTEFSSDATGLINVSNINLENVAVNDEISFQLNNAEVLVRPSLRRANPSLTNRTQVINYINNNTGIFLCSGFASGIQNVFIQALKSEAPGFSGNTINFTNNNNYSRYTQATGSIIIDTGNMSYYEYIIIGDLYIQYPYDFNSTDTLLQKINLENGTSYCSGIKISSSGIGITGLFIDGRQGELSNGITLQTSSPYVYLSNSSLTGGFGIATNFFTILSNSGNLTGGRTYGPCAFTGFSSGTSGSIRATPPYFNSLILETGTFLTINISGISATGHKVVWQSASGNFVENEWERNWTNFNLFSGSTAYQSGTVSGNNITYSGYFPSDQQYLRLLQASCSNASGIIKVNISGDFGYGITDKFPYYPFVSGYIGDTGIYVRSSPTTYFSGRVAGTEYGNSGDFIQIAYSVIGSGLGFVPNNYILNAKYILTGTVTGMSRTGYYNYDKVVTGSGIFNSNNYPYYPFGTGFTQASGTINFNFNSLNNFDRLYIKDTNTYVSYTTNIGTFPPPQYFDTVDTLVSIITGNESTFYCSGSKINSTGILLTASRNFALGNLGNLILITGDTTGIITKNSYLSGGQTVYPRIYPTTNFTGNITGSIASTGFYISTGQRITQITGYIRSFTGIRTFSGVWGLQTGFYNVYTSFSGDSLISGGTVYQKTGLFEEPSNLLQLILSYENQLNTDELDIVDTVSLQFKDLNYPLIYPNTNPNSGIFIFGITGIKSF